ncbi:hypothetical protein [Nocardia cerradoensis]|uniref:Phage head morphogenesis domain-containing protein n=1 Tax=Nocardia cerradoensis TaxID=85688 RepID=A0A231GSX4_9NOCA|nr:hypothetical protein [Nocardia cerradoensis]NKY48019.1 hypothetical protein [Nocardia cerradoensis]OXR39720.1 hypothetical protein B7C42_08208 [Nocardia cerradoensis]
MRAEQRAALVEILTLERELEDLAADTIRAWLGTATQAALPVLTAASIGDIPPDPDGIARTAAAWDAEVNTGFLPRFGAIVDRLLGDDRDRLGEWRNRMVGAMRDRLSGIPARARKRVEAAIRDTVGQPLDAVRRAAARALSYADSWRGDATEIGRTAVGVFNAARIARAELETADTSRALDKVWLALHDGRTRHTHQLADRQRVPLGTDFVVGSATLPYPGWIGGPPEEVIGCRCVVAIVESALEIPAPARVASAADTGGTTVARSFEALLIPTGVVGRSQGWMLASNVQLVDTALPLAMKWQKKADPGHEGAYTVAVIQSIEVREGGVWGRGVTLDTPEAAEAAAEVEAMVSRPSIELVGRSEVLTDSAGNPVTPDTAEQMWMDGAAIVSRIDVAEIVAATLVSVPEFRDAHMILGDEVDNSQGLALVAAAKARTVDPDIYPAEFFDNPDLDEPTPIHVTREGRVVGHLACWKTMHTAYPDMQVTPYRSYSGYAEFHQSTAHLDNGERLRVGRLTVGGGHAVAGHGMRAAIEHYDDVGTCWSLVRAYEDAIGIAVSGVIEANADEKMVKLALGTPHSGHWERVGGHPELLIGHAVNSPGFPIPVAQRLRDRDGDLALVASFAPRPSRPPLPASLLEDIARRGAAAYAEQQAATARQATARELIANAVPRRRVLADAIKESHARHARKAS